HNKKFNHLSRKKAHREALLSNLTISLIMHKRIFTTLAKAKALRVYAEPLITRCKTDNMANRRLVFSYLQNKNAVKELFGVVAEKVADRPGGYTRILKTVHRLGDNAEMAMIELVDFNELMLSEKSSKKEKTTRRSRRKKSADTAAPKAVESKKEEKPEEKEETPETTAEAPVETPKEQVSEEKPEEGEKAASQEETEA
ncbi:MAG: 50S ribosomal protein L17, partial [Muribaculaceae bacterium]|nr:50S ribosomal protein L17 [Muribaculaceae bacterium]